MSDEAARDIIARVIVREGGIGDAQDGKGITRWGQTPDWLDDFGFVVPESPADAARNYRLWLEKTRLIVLCTASDALADAVIDFAVNSSHEPAIKELQRALGVRPDGVLGRQTQAALATADRDRIARRVLGGRLRFLGKLITKNPGKHAKQAAGWMNRVSAQVETL